MEGKRKTIADVARRVGVSSACVSFVLNNRPSISKETVAKVRKAMDEIGYQPRAVKSMEAGDEARRRLRSSATLAFVAMRHEGPGLAPVYSEVLRGATERAGDLGVDLRILFCPDAKELQSALRKHMIDGMILIGPGTVNNPAIAPLISTVPSVRTMGEVAVPQLCDHVTYDNATVGRLAADFLAGRTGGPLAVISLKDLSPGGLYTERTETFLRKAASLGRQARKVVIESPTELSAAVASLMRSPHSPKGVFLIADVYLATVHSALAAMGRKPGVDVELIGCNNESFYLEPLTPRSASVDLHADLIGAKAVDVLLERLANPTAPLLKLLYEPEVAAAGDESAYTRRSL